MSLDYPNRAIWLAKRYTPRDLWKRRGRVVWSGGTFNRGRKKAKLAHRAAGRKGKAS